MHKTVKQLISFFLIFTILTPMSFAFADMGDVKYENSTELANGFKYTNELIVHYSYDTETGEWSCEHSFKKVNTYEIYETTSWSGTGQDMFHTWLFSDDKIYTLTLNPGELSQITGTFTIANTNGAVIEEYAVNCIEFKDNKYRLSFGQTIGNYIDGFIVVYDDSENAFVFDDYNIKGTLTKK